MNGEESLTVEDSNELSGVSGLVAFEQDDVEPILILDLGAAVGEVLDSGTLRPALPEDQDVSHSVRVHRLFESVAACPIGLRDDQEKSSLGELWRAAGEGGFQSGRGAESPCVTTAGSITSGWADVTPGPGSCSLVADLGIRVLTEDGEVLRQLTLDPTRDYQPQEKP
jgi:hypothetical protein